jgi:dihydroorotate dehydrogenase
VTAYERFFRTVLTRSDAEQVHRRSVAALRAASPALAAHGRRVRAAAEPVEALGLTFRGPLGLAAGFDKNATAVDALAALGFSSIEVGTVTGRPQPGNPRPRVFRLPDDRAVVNRMGFNNDGAEVVANRLARRAARWAGSDCGCVVLGVNIGKTKVVPEEEAVGDYELSARLLAPYADYLVVNVSSPNTPGLRDLQAVERLEPLLRAVGRTADEAAGRHVPLLVKIAPDLTDEDVLAVADLAVATSLDGVIATNTSISREGLRTPEAQVAATGAGGLSGAPLRGRACEVMRSLRARVGPDLTLVGSGGIDTVEDARERLDAGATLVQGWTGLVYGGPLWPARLQRGLQRGLQQELTGTAPATGGGDAAR